MLLRLLAVVACSPIALALGESKVIGFPIDDVLEKIDNTQNGGAQATFSSSSTNRDKTWFTIASENKEFTAPFLLDSKDNTAIHLAAQTLARDIHTITGSKPILYNDTLPSNVSTAIIIGSIHSKLIEGTKTQDGVKEDLDGKWESYDARVVHHPIKGLDSALVVTGSDRVSATSL